MKNKLILLTALSIGLSSCDLIDSIGPSGKLGGDQSAIGEVGNTFSLGSISGVGNFSAEVTKLEDGVSTITGSIVITDPQMLEAAKYAKGVTWNGNTGTVSKKYRITSEGIQSVYDEGNLTLVKYDDKVGDSYSLKLDGRKITRTVDYKSTDDDYAWGFFDIKVMKITETGRGVPGVNKLEFIANHKFGLVGFKVYFEDGSEKEVRFFSSN